MHALVSSLRALAFPSAYLVLVGEFRGERIGDFGVQLLKPFLEALCVGARLTLHIRFYGENDHHKIERHLQGPGPGDGPSGDERREKVCRALRA